METTLRESLPALLRLESRHAIFRDPAYAELWQARAARTAHDLEELGALLLGREELRYHRKSVGAFEAYRQLAADDLGRVAPAGGSAPPPNPATRRAAARTELALERLADATYAALERAEEVAHTLQQRAWRNVSTALPLAVLAGIAGAALVAFGMTRSLRLLSAAAGEVARGSFAGPVRVRGGDEIAELAEAFNRMAAQLGELDRMKEEFFAHISHELRTPLTAVREATNLLHDEVPGPLTAKQARLVEIIRTSSERVLGLVNQILELSRLEAGLLTVDLRRIDLDRLVGRALDELRPQAEAHGLVLERNGSAPAGAVRGDEDRLLEVLVNLLSNAIKFTPAGGTVRVQTSAHGDEVEIAVEDSGIGIPADALPHVFERYWQASGTRGGSGLGLAIVKGIVQAHGGVVHAESRAGGGSRFSVRLPRQGAPA
jgi:two-component system sensor histidine kinase GlrK